MTRPNAAEAGIAIVARLNLPLLKKLMTALRNEQRIVEGEVVYYAMLSVRFFQDIGNKLLDTDRTMDSIHRLTC